jgi:hypothetical protein
MLAPNFVTEEGMVMAVKLLQFWKQLLPINSSPSAKETVSKAEQPRNAEAMISVTELGMDTDVRLVQFSKAPKPVYHSLLQ